MTVIGGGIRHHLPFNGSRRSILGRKQEEAIAALLTQRNVEDAARAAKIGTRTSKTYVKTG